MLLMGHDNQLDEEPPITKGLGVRADRSSKFRKCSVCKDQRSEVLSFSFAYESRFKIRDPRSIPNYIRDLIFTSTEPGGRPLPSVCYGPSLRCPSRRAGSTRFVGSHPGRPHGSSYGPRHCVNGLYRLAPASNCMERMYLILTICLEIHR